MRVGSPEDCCRDPPVVTQPPTSSATEESEGAPPLTAGLAAHRPTKHPLEHLYKYKYKGTFSKSSTRPAAPASAAKLAPGFWASVSSPSIGFIFIVGRPRTYVISGLDFGSRVYLAQWELARSLAERRLLAERECLGR